MFNTTILRGSILYATPDQKIISIPKGFIVSNKGKIKGVYETLPSEYDGFVIEDYGDNLIIPAFCDMHLHASQFYQRGVGMDVQLLEWLDTYTFPNEASFKDESMAKDVYSKFVKELIKQGTLCASIFATVHLEATTILANLLEQAGIRSFVGKVNMDMNCPDYIKEDSLKSLEDTKEFIERTKNNKFAKPIITPRFSPSCTEKLHKMLGDLSIETNTFVQSHLCESIGEIDFVKELFPSYEHYSDVYMKNNLLGPEKSIMAHCIFLDDMDKKAVKENNTLLVHCPTSNSNIVTGFMRAKELLDNGYNLAMGTDIGGGNQTQMYKEMASAIRTSKLLSYQEQKNHTLSIGDVFYMATAGGGSFIGNTGSFMPDYDMTALVIDDSDIDGFKLEPLQRLERFCYIGDDRNIIARYSVGKKL